MRIFGLVGKNISYSYSKEFFRKKFLQENINDAKYSIFDIKNIKDIKNIVNKNVNIHGLNITIPYKEKIIDMIDELSPDILNIGAVNTIKIISSKWIGYNTDIYGFKKSFLEKKQKYHKKAIILGTGGSSKAVIYVLKKLDIPYICVTRKINSNNNNIISNSNNNNIISYNDISYEIMKEHQIIINCTPVGTYPNIKKYPNIPYTYITKNHYMYDLIYNPYLTLFLKYGKNLGCTIQNGINMLTLQAEKSWQIWNL